MYESNFRVFETKQSLGVASRGESRYKGRDAIGSCVLRGLCLDSHPGQDGNIVSSPHRFLRGRGRRRSAFKGGRGPWSCSRERTNMSGASSPRVNGAGTRGPVQSRVPTLALRVSAHVVSPPPSSAMCARCQPVWQDETLDNTYQKSKPKSKAARAMAPELVPVAGVCA